MDAPYWFPVVTLVLGALAGYFADYLRESRAATREREEARRTFQRETLIELQDQIASLARAVGRGHHEDFLEHARSGLWARGSLSEEVNLGEMQAIREIHRLRVRLTDRDLSQRTEKFIGLATAVGLPGVRAPGDDAAMKERSERCMAELVDAFGPMNERLGEALRDYL